MQIRYKICPSLELGEGTGTGTGIAPACVSGARLKFLLKCLTTQQGSDPDQREKTDP